MNIRTKAIVIILSVFLLAGGVIIITLSKRAAPTDDLQAYKKPDKSVENDSKEVVLSATVENEQVFPENRDITEKSKPLAEVLPPLPDKAPVISKPHQAERSTPVAQTVSTPPLEEIRPVVDASMEKVGGRHIGHQEIRDAQGHIIKRTFLYAIGEDTFDTDMGEETPDIGIDEIYDNVHIAKAKRNEGQQLLEEARVEGDEAKLKTAAKLLVQANRELTGGSDYVTLNIAATTDLPPILSFQYGLPDSVIMLDSAIQIAQEESGEGCTLQEIRQHGMIGSIFVVKTQSGQTLYVDPQKNTVFTAVREVVVGDKENQLSTSEQEERTNRIHNQWAEFLEQGFDPNMFTLDDLTDLSKDFDPNIFTLDDPNNLPK